MKRFKIGLAAGVLAALFLTAMPATAQAPAQTPDTAASEGAIEGATSAQAAGTAVWALSGFAGGLTLGPIGAGLAYAIADGSSSSLPLDLQSKVGRKGSEYSLAYQQAYTQRLISRRKRASLVGGAAGTALLVVGTVGAYMQMR